MATIKILKEEASSRSSSTGGTQKKKLPQNLCRSVVLPELSGETAVLLKRKRERMSKSNGRGRPKKFTDEKKDTFIELLYQGQTIPGICNAMSIDTSTYRKARAADEDFAKRVDEAKQFRVRLVEDALYMNAVEGNFPAQRFFLINRAPESWKAVQKVEARVTGMMANVNGTPAEFGHLDKETLLKMVDNLAQIYRITDEEDDE